MYTLSNDKITITIASFGAELQSIRDQSGTEYLWHGDKQFWGRRSPVLFPLVGSLNHHKYMYKGKSYDMGQHGFARDHEFSLISQTDSEVWFVLKDSEDTRKCYPFAFELQVGYRLIGTEIQVIWKVINRDSKNIFFSIGAHPAFLCQEGDWIHFNTEHPLTYHRINEDGLYLTEEHIVELANQSLERTKGFFDDGVYIIENNQATEVTLQNASQMPYLQVRFDAPLFGIWAPAGDCPFVCIEPWYGRCDSTDYQGDLQHREWGNTLQPNEVFATSYSIEILPANR